MFDIRDYIGKPLVVTETTPSQTTVKCPCCGGKLRIRNSITRGKNYSSYLCVTQHCNKNDIRKALGVDPTNIKCSTKYNPDNYTIVNSFVSLNEIARTKRSISYKLQSSEEYDPYYRQNVRKTTYYYDQTHKLYRVDLLKSNAKQVYPNYLDPFTNEWKIGVIDRYPWYNHELIKDNRYFFTVVEGEKTAHHVTEHGIIAVSPPLGFGWSSEALEESLYHHINNMKGLLLIPDNDSTGVKKMKLLAEICSYLKIPTKVLMLDKHYRNKGEDLYDIIERGYEPLDVIRSYLEDEF